MTIRIDGTNTAANPGITGADADTGLQFGTDEVNIVTGGSTRATVDSSGRLLVGTSTARTNINNASWAGFVGLNIEGAANYGTAINLANNNSGNAYGMFNFLKSNTTSIGSNTLVASGNTVGMITFQGNDGTEFVQAAAISAAIDSTPGANDMPGRLVFSTTADGASSPTERMRLNSAGALKVRANGAASVTNNDSASHELTTDRSGYEALYVVNRDSTDPFGIQVYHPTDVSSAFSYFLQCYGSSTLRAGFRTNGGLANYQSNNVNLSDINSKKDISLAAGTWDCIKEWEIVNYRYKDQPDDADLNLGVIAQQVAEGCPEVITVFSDAKEAKAAVLDDDGNEVEPAQEAQPEKLGVKEQQMMWMAIKALQEAQTRIETLETANAALEARLTALEGGTN